MKFGDKLQGAIERFDDKGRGAFTKQITPKETREVVIPFTAPGDTVEATFMRRGHRGQWVGKLDKVTEQSPMRVPAPCPFAGTCGGCLWQHVDYDAQRKTKRDMINAAFAAAGHDERIEDVMASKKELYYRNRMDYVWSFKGDLGLKEYGSWNRYVNLTTCFLLDEQTPKTLEVARALVKDLGLEPWDAKKYKGDVRYLVIRVGKNTNERMITLVVKDAAKFTDTMRAELVRRFSPLCTTLYLGENPTLTDLSYAKTLTLLHGNPYLTEEVNGLRYLIHPNSFFQTNSDMAAMLQTTVMSFLGDLKDARLLDLYCGLGFFGIAAARHGATAYGHELDAEAITLAKKNAELNGLAERATFGAGPVEKFDWASFDPTAVILDPPRVGLHPRVIKTILEKRPKTIIYVSCNFRSFAKELTQFKEAYRVEDIKALDLFPQTPHVELVTKLVLK
ncbi:MAG: 23S rRNA (uracil(1939)-C(5))-methyltransferase RlmD [bacterium]|nr:23S rRNA (uracil(1939)-C(5))-methyltransferase RlmD [bacterium]